MLDFPVELHCTAQDQDCVSENKIIEDIRCTFAHEFRLLITFNITCEKHNAYFLSCYDELYMEQDPEEIVANLRPLPLDMAQSIFPMYKFDKENYFY